MSGTLAPVGRHQFFDNDGNPLAGGFLHTYLSGTSTESPTYANSELTVANDNPIPLDSAGRATIYLAALAYKWILKDADGNTIWTQDPVSSVALGQSILGSVFNFGGSPESPVTDTTYPSGATYDKLVAGSAIFTVDAANLVGTYAIRGMLMAPAGETITVALVNLSDGSPDTPIATISSTNTAGEPKLSGPITWPSGGAEKQYGVKAKVTGGVGFRWAITLERTA